MNRPKRIAPQGLGPQVGKKLKVSTDAEDIAAFASVVIPGLPLTRGGSSTAPPPPPPSPPAEQLRGRVRKNTEDVSRTGTPLKPPPQAQAQERTLKSHDDGASGLLDQEVILSKIRHFSQPADILVMSATNPVDLYKGGLYDLGKVKFCSWFILFLLPCRLCVEFLISSLVGLHKNGIFGQGSDPLVK